jgi:hypothetical protein
LWPESEATLAAGGVRCLGSTCRRSVGPNPPLVTHLGSRLCDAAIETMSEGPAWGRSANDDPVDLRIAFCRKLTHRRMRPDDRTRGQASWIEEHF